jgi:hypothetical protein
LLLEIVVAHLQKYAFSERSQLISVKEEEEEEEERMQDNICAIK